MGCKRLTPTKNGDCLLTHSPYQSTTHNGIRYKAHRLIFLQQHGFLPEVVMHTCDEPRCININHLVAGTTALNNKDRASKERSAKVVLSRRKFCRKRVKELFEQGLNFKQIAEKVGVSYGGSFVRDARRGIASSA